MHGQRIKTRALILIPMLALGWASLVQAQRQEAKEPASGAAAKAKEQALLATKQMEKASSVEKTGVPERDDAASGKPTHPPTKQMDTTASPEKTK